MFLYRGSDIEAPICKLCMTLRGYTILAYAKINWTVVYHAMLWQYNVLLRIKKNYQEILRIHMNYAGIHMNSLALLRIPMNYSGILKDSQELLWITKEFC